MLTMMYFITVLRKQTENNIFDRLNAWFKL